MRHLKGFSLVELVVVILLIGILSAVAVPRLFSSTDKAHRAAIQNLQSQMSATLNVIAGEWLLNGSQNPYVIDGVSYKMSQYGYPDVTVTAVGMMQPGVLPATSASSEACKQFLVKVIGLPEGLVGVKPDAAVTMGSADVNMGKTWVAEFTGISNAVTPAPVVPVPDTTLSPNTVAAYPGVSAPNTTATPTNAVPPATASSNGKCVYHYHAGLNNTASIAYMPNERFAVTSSGI